jgi:hypothetical protein
MKENIFLFTQISDGIASTLVEVFAGIFEQRLASDHDGVGSALSRRAAVRSWFLWRIAWGDLAPRGRAQRGGEAEGAQRPRSK